jgi:hypothetical protein
MTFRLLLKELALIVINLEHKLSLRAAAIIGFRCFSRGWYFASAVTDDCVFTCNGIAGRRKECNKIKELKQ